MWQNCSAYDQIGKEKEEGNQGFHYSQEHTLNNFQPVTKSHLLEIFFFTTSEQNQNDHKSLTHDTLEQHCRYKLEKVFLRVNDLNPILFTLVITSVTKSLQIGSLSFLPVFLPQPECASPHTS